MIFIGPDGEKKTDPRQQYRTKIFIRTLLYSTSNRGQTVESLYVSLRSGKTVVQDFPIWIYGDEYIARGSGLYVSMEGVACNHHFLLPHDGSEFRLLAGDYCLRVYGKRVVDKIPIELASIQFSISTDEAIQLINENVGVYLDWVPDRQEYQSHTVLHLPKETVLK